MARARCAAKQLAIVFTSVSHVGPSTQSQLLSKESLVPYGFLSPPAVNTALAPGLPEFIREHLNHTELSCTKAVGGEGQINWRRAGACWIIMRHVNRRLASYRLHRGPNKVGRADYWEFWRQANWEASRRLFAWVGGNGVSTSCPAIRGLPRSLCRRTVTVRQIYPLFQFH